ncbi:unnamed protein product [Trichobilharzia szidati]|nr:unnamed protein product [Trichobilharzia szidati]
MSILCPQASALSTGVQTLLQWSATPFTQAGPTGVQLQQFTQSPQQQQIQAQAHQLQPAQQPTYIQQHQQQPTMMATDVPVSGQPDTVAACSDATPQFIILAPGAPLKLMTVGPNGQLIQTTGVPQFMPTASVGMPINQPTATLQPQQTSVQVLLNAE